MNRKAIPKTTGGTASARNFTLPRSFTIENIQTIFTEVKEHQIEDGTRFIVDASETDIITTPGLQLLASLSATVVEKGGRLDIVARSDAFASACVTLGMGKQLEQWESNNG